MSAATAPRRLRLSAEARGMLPWCLALSVAAHVLLLAGAAPPGPRLGGLTLHAGSRSAPTAVQLIPADRAQEMAALAFGANALPAAPADGGQEMLPRTMNAASAAGSASASASVATSVASVTSAPASTPASAPVAASRPLPAAAAATDPWAPGNPAQGAYLPRPLLSIAPVVNAPVLIATPPGADDGARHVGVLSLFIDEHGRVRHIEAGDPSLPDALERAAREAFMAAQFSPGQVQGRVVKSRLNVEIAFDAARVPVAPASAASAATAASAQRAR